MARLIMGHNVYICNECVNVAYESLEEERREEGGGEDATPNQRDLDAQEALEDEQAEAEDQPLPKPLEILARLDEHVIGQSMAKRIVATAAYNHYKRRKAVLAGEDLGVKIQKSNILITGPSGCGKTEIGRALAEIMGVPFYVQDATKLTQAGYVGEDVDVIAQGLLEKARGNVELAQWGIVFLDETDKLARKSGRDASAYRDVSGEGVQQSLLKIIEGDEITVAQGKGSRLMDSVLQRTVTIDTTNVLFICAGSFAGIKEVVQRRRNESARVGFGGQAKEEVDEREIYENICEADILEFGIIPEFAGRVPVITSVLQLTEDEMTRILTEPKNALTKQYQALYQLDGVELEYGETILSEIAQEACTRETNARALRAILEDIMLPYNTDVPSDLEIEKVTFAGGMADEPEMTRGTTRAEAHEQAEADRAARQAEREARRAAREARRAEMEEGAQAEIDERRAIERELNQRPRA